MENNKNLAGDMIKKDTISPKKLSFVKDV